MTLAEIWPTLQTLSQTDKRLLVQALAAELAREEEASLVDVGGSYAIWSPFDAHEAAATLQRLLESSEPPK